PSPGRLRGAGRDGELRGPEADGDILTENSLAHTHGPLEHAHHRRLPLDLCHRRRLPASRPHAREKVADACEYRARLTEGRKDLFDVAQEHGPGAHDEDA